MPSEEIEDGDLVYGYDLETGEVVEREVTETLKNFTFFWVDIELADEIVTATRCGAKCASGWSHSRSG